MRKRKIDPIELKKRRKLKNYGHDCGGKVDNADEDDEDVEDDEDDKDNVNDDDDEFWSILLNPEYFATEDLA